MPIGPVEDSAVELTLPYLPTTVADMVRLQRLTGMGPDEVCQLRPRDVDRTGDVWSYTPDHHKTQHAGKAACCVHWSQGARRAAVVPAT